MGVGSAILASDRADCGQVLECVLGDLSAAEARAESSWNLPWRRCQSHGDGTALLQSYFINYEINMPLPGTKNPICSVLGKGMMLRTGA